MIIFTELWSCPHILLIPLLSVPGWSHVLIKRPRSFFMCSSDNPRSGFRSCCVTASSKSIVHVLYSGTHTQINIHHLGWHLVLWFHNENAKGYIFSQCHPIKTRYSMGQALDPTMRKVTIDEFQDSPWDSRCHCRSLLSLPIQQFFIHYDCCISSNITDTLITHIRFHDLLPDYELKLETVSFTVTFEDGLLLKMAYCWRWWTIDN